jgi:hypothetical protein
MQFYGKLRCLAARIFRCSNQAQDSHRVASRGNTRAAQHCPLPRLRLTSPAQADQPRYAVLPEAPLAPPLGTGNLERQRRMRGRLRRAAGHDLLLHPTSRPVTLLPSQQIIKLSPAPITGRQLAQAVIIAGEQHADSRMTGTAPRDTFQLGQLRG